ncbi:MAG TPA: PAS domain-containing sensor histidine kinase [Thermoanaerobaculia bacterium]|nr:PAS domain-containing sensor histidine kinase [Thermoanaerobaculia bacterium]
MNEIAASLLENINRAIAVVRHDGTIAYRNRAFEDCFGDQAEAWTRGAAQSVAGQRGWIEAFVHGREDHEAEVSFSGRVFQVTRIHIETAEPYLALSFEDITRQQEVEQARSDFTSMIVHDLRGPLSGIQGALDFVLDQGKGVLDPTFSDLLEEASREAERMMNLVDELLDFSKIQSGNFVMEKETVHPGRVLKRAVKSLQPAAQRAGITLLSAHRLDLPVVQSNGDKLTQAVINLLSNALKFTPRGGVVSVSAATAPRNGKSDLLISVTDSGIGIKSEDQGKLFQKYKQSRGKSFRGGGGTGLGLYIVKEIVEAHGGRISLSSIEGAGTSITFTIPLSEAAH